MKLTELLYPYDEVVMSLIQCILKKNFEESLYWAWELIYSGEDIMNILNNIFLDFYAVYNPHLERLIKILNKYYKLYNNNICVANIIYNFINSKPSILVFKYRNNIDYKPTYIYKKKEWIKQFPKNFHPLIQSIKMKNYNNISFYLRHCCINYGSELTHLNIIKYFKYLYNNCDIDEIINYWNNKLSSNHYHTLLAMIFSFIHTEHNFNDSLYNSKCKCDYEYVNECICYFDNDLFKFIETHLVEELDDHYKSIHLDKNYLKLRYRLYPIHNILGPNPTNIRPTNLNYDRNNINNINDVYNNWLQYIGNTPSWKNRLNEYNILIDNNNIICSEDSLEFFNDIYDYEYDEQPLYIKNMTNQNTHIYYNFDEWFNYIINNPLNIILNIDEC